MSAGEYVLAEPIQVPRAATVDLRNITLRYPPNADFLSLLEIAASRSVEIIGGTFDGSVQEQPTWQEHQHAIRVSGSTHITIHGCTFINLSGDGVFVDGASTNVRIHHCTFRGQNTN